MAGKKRKENWLEKEVIPGQHFFLLFFPRMKIVLESMSSYCYLSSSHTHSSFFIFFLSISRRRRRRKEKELWTRIEMQNIEMNVSLFLFTIISPFFLLHLHLNAFKECNCIRDGEKFISVSLPFFFHFPVRMLCNECVPRFPSQEPFELSCRPKYGRIHVKNHGIIIVIVAILNKFMIISNQDLLFDCWDQVMNALDCHSFSRNYSIFPAP